MAQRKIIWTKTVINLKLKITILLLTAYFNCSSQQFTSDKNEIRNILYSRIENTGKTILKAVQSKKLKAYKMDLITEYDSIEFADLNIYENVCGLNCLYKINSSPESLKRDSEIKGIGLIQKVNIQNIDLGESNSFFVKIEDVEKIISKADIKLISILSNILYPISTEALQNESDISQNYREQYNFLRESLSTFSKEVRITEYNLTFLNNLIIQNIAKGFLKAKSKNMNETYTLFYHDSNLTNLVSFNYLNYELPDKINTKILVDSNENIISYDIIYTPIFEGFKTLKIHNNAIGLNYKENQNDYTFYLPKTILYSYLPSWVVFMIDDILTIKK